MMPNLFGMVEPITITKKQYESFIRDSERVEILKRIVKKDDYIRLDEIKSILEIEDDEPVPELKHPSTNLDDYADY